MIQLYNANIDYIKNIMLSYDDILTFNFFTECLEYIKIR